jgi:uncharacterized protein (TIGR02996 family)
MARDELLSAVLASLDDLQVRLVLADWYMSHGDPRGELIVVRCQLKDETLSQTQREALQEREALASWVSL